MTKPHPNAALIHALADGKTIEARLVGSDEGWDPLFGGARPSAYENLLKPGMWSNVRYEFRIAEDVECTPS